MVFIAIIVGFLSISEGFSERLQIETNTEETDYMVDSFNHMMDSLERSYNQQKQFVEDASHELRTPLQIIQGHLKLISRWGRHKPEVNCCCHQK